MKTFLYQIVSSFGAHISVAETIEELKRHQMSTDPTGMFSLNEDEDNNYS